MISWWREVGRLPPRGHPTRPRTSSSRFPHAFMVVTSRSIAFLVPPTHLHPRHVVHACLFFLPLGCSTCNLHVTIAGNPAFVAATRAHHARNDVRRRFERVFPFASHVGRAWQDAWNVPLDDRVDGGVLGVATRPCQRNAAARLPARGAARVRVEKRRRRRSDERLTRTRRGCRDGAARGTSI